MLTTTVIEKRRYRVFFWILVVNQQSHRVGSVEGADNGNSLVEGVVEDLADNRFWIEKC